MRFCSCWLCVCGAMHLFPPRDSCTHCALQGELAVLHRTFSLTRMDREANGVCAGLKGLLEGYEGCHSEVHPSEGKRLFRFCSLKGPPKGVP